MLLWVFIRLSECQWVLMVLIGLLCVRKGPYWFLCILMCPYGTYKSLCVLWVLMVPYRPYRS